MQRDGWLQEQRRNHGIGCPSFRRGGLLEPKSPSARERSPQSGPVSPRADPACKQPVELAEDRRRGGVGWGSSDDSWEGVPEPPRLKKAQEKESVKHANNRLHSAGLGEGQSLKRGRTALPPSRGLCRNHGRRKALHICNLLPPKPRNRGACPVGSSLCLQHCGLEYKLDGTEQEVQSGCLPGRRWVVQMVNQNRESRAGSRGQRSPDSPVPFSGQFSRPPF